MFDGDVLVLIHRDLGSGTIRHFECDTLVLCDGYFDLDIDRCFLGLGYENFGSNTLKLMKWYYIRRTINHPVK